MRHRIFFLIIIFLMFHRFLYSQSNQIANLKANEKDHVSQMAALLRDHYLKADFIGLGKIFLNDKGIEYYKKRLADCKDPERILLIKNDLANQMLRDGRVEESIEIFTEILPLSENFSNQELYPGNLFSNLKKTLALAYVRLGEQKNCILNHGSESCILPIKGRGIHVIKEPMRKAIKIYKELLLADSTDIESKWLMNLAYMSLGHYPDSVRAKNRIPIHTFDSPYPYGTFRDIAPELGLDLKGLSGSVIMDDFDNDNDLDVFFCNMGFDSPCQYFVNNGDGSFSNRSKESGFAGEVSGRTCIQADYNNDGFMDIYIVRGAWERQEDNMPPSSLMRNNGNGTFTDVTIESGLLGFHPSYNAVWFDYNNDGRIDLFVSNESLDPENPHFAKLYKNNGDGTFINVAKEVGLTPEGWTKGAISFDYNNDNWPDLYICRADGKNYLYKNSGNRGNGIVQFTNVAMDAGVLGHQVSFYTFPIDFNNDGWIDLYTSKSAFDYSDLNNAIINEYLGKPSRKSYHPLFYMNNKDGTFRDATDEVKLNRVIKNMGINTGDIDNDGYPDIYAGTGALSLASLVPNLMLRNYEGKYFEDVTMATGTGNLQHGHGVSFGDIDNDGDQDIFEVMGDGYSGDVYQNVLYENPGSPNHWINLKMEGVQSNRAGIGVRVQVNVQTAEGTRNIFSTVSSGGSFGASCLRREIGLANAEKINYIEIYWPSTGIKQVFKEVKMDRFYKIRETEKSIQELSIKRILLKKKEDSLHHK